MMKILVTGGVGFIGSALARRLCDDGHIVVVLDNFNEYYDLELKRARQKVLLGGIEVVEGDITSKDDLEKIFDANNFDLVCHLAAQAGVRYSVTNPEIYSKTNVLGTQLLFETMKDKGVKRMVFASTSSVYGNSTTPPYTEDSLADRPVSIYAASKRSGEMIAYSYFEQYGIATTCLRFFTVYGPWSRPDMAMFKFTELIKKGRPIEIYNNGDLRRDFTYIDDIVEGFVKAVEKPLGYEIVNLGNGYPIELIKFIDLLEETLGQKAERKLVPMQSGDVYETFASTKKAEDLLAFKAKVSFEDGVKSFVNWFNDYYQHF